ncbi:uncharacterized protein LOC105385039 [Plutella xylostella]|uniref:uncharacterized protein LOC105385039 n=1 Tax=Plutella xylostella TaxID=51655 RepID=UPI0020325D78|nr:uncharacterized protein LOC105385039 [Plutella xylostella]
MNMLGYLVTLMNIQITNYDYITKSLPANLFQSFREHSSPINDVTIKVGEVGHLAAGLMQEGIFHRDDFRETGYHRRGNIGRFISKKFQDFLNYNNVSATEDGVAVTLVFSKEGGQRGVTLPQGTKRPPLQPRPQEMQEKFLHRETRIADDRVEGL